MKQTPEEKRIQKLMQPGSITLEGFLGNDSRHYHEIINEDEQVMQRLGITKEQIADRLQQLTELAYKSFDGLIELENGIRVEYVSVRGRVPSPFQGQKPAPKGYVRYYDPGKNLKLNWTPLNIQMIREFGFFEGKGSQNRLEPILLYRVLFSD